MQKPRTHLLAPISLAILVASLVILSAPGSHAAPPDKDVNVVNTAANPVPVQVQGVTPVSVTNSPTVGAQQLGQWNVVLSGTPTVQVGNDSSTPLPVRDVDNPARQSFQRELDPLVPSGSFSASDSLTVPAGKRFVIEFASASIDTTAGTKMWVRIQTTSSGVGLSYSLLPQLQGNFGADGSDFLLASQPMKLYADPGTQVTVVVNVLGGVANTNTGAAVSLSGYLVVVP
jgi:hypothetical protein